ncbi:uracil-DNA glycosylase family protein [Undibacterium sp. TJN25]|uniref:uracil-DNA glycosylase family protein n=1 Tax=Undibacterium sp. TJN25 TaxID=3413056 RepID=UPI003BF09B26
MKKVEDASSALYRDIVACTYCAPHLAAGPRPIVQFASTARILIIGQAPGARVHASGIPWDDQSGDRLREWTGLSKPDFYDAGKVALMPMGFCYPGKGKNGDLPPRPECAPLWHDSILVLLPADRLTLLVGSYAQAHYLPQVASRSLSENVQAFESFLPAFFSLPHPSWRSVGWMKKNPWFESRVLPALKKEVRQHLG